MIALASGIVLGLACGAGVTAWLLSRRGGDCPDPDVHELTETDRVQIAAEFQTHTTALHQQVSQYADLLAGDDPVLRARLRQFERGGQS